MEDSRATPVHSEGRDAAVEALKLEGGGLKTVRVEFWQDGVIMDKPYYWLSTAWNQGCW